MRYNQQEQLRQIIANVIWGFLEWAEKVKGIEAATLYHGGVDRLQLIEQYQHYQEQAILGQEGQEGE